MPKKSKLEAGSGVEPSRINAGSLRRVLHDGALSWQALMERLDAEDGERHRQLRKVLKWLVRNEEVLKDGKGNYAWAANQEQDPSKAKAKGKAKSKDQSAAQPNDAEQQLVVGVLNTETRYPYVEAIGAAHKGKVNLLGDAGRGFAHGDTVSIRIVAEDRYGPKGELVARLARGGGVAQASETLLNSYEVPREWPDGMAAVVEKLPTKVAAASHRGRVDLRDTPLVTIDGATAKDFDDAVYAESVGRGGWRLLVAIADVAHYVHHNSVLDREAQLRGNSVYLPDRVIPMLPEELSNGLCSLRPEENRLAMVCEMRIAASGRVSSHRFYSAVIRSWARLTYEQVGGYLEGEDLAVDAPVTRSLDTLHAVYKAMRMERAERGALDFSGREATIRIENDRPVGIDPVQRNDAHKLIEEAMIAANVCAARFLEKADVPGMYRVHEPPGVEKTEQLREAMAYAGIRLPKGDLTSKTVHQALAGLQRRDNSWLMEGLVLRALSQARYTPENKGHFGLALPRYMHFTSPIRRYADLVVHRALKAAIAQQAKGEDGASTKAPKAAHVYSPDQLLSVGEHLSSTERRADEVSWGVDGWLKCEFMGEHIGEHLDGIVAGVTEFGLFVELEDFYVQGLVHISELGRDYFQFQPQSLSLVGERSGRTFAMGDALRVHLVDVNPPKGRIELLLAESDKKERDTSKPPRSSASKSGKKGTGKSGKQPRNKSRKKPSKRSKR
ncbi:MAG: ribonuclease R [Pseudomonadales bacterium]